MLKLFECSQNSNLRLASLIWLTKHELYLDELCELTGFSPEALAEVPATHPKTVFFPVVMSSGQASIAKAYVYILPSNYSRAIALTGHNIASCNHLSHLSSKNCVIAFDQSIEGNSWQLAALAALIDNGRYPITGLAFSGIVHADGRITSASDLQVKASCCKAEGLSFISRIETVSALSNWLNSDTIPLPVAQLQGNKRDLELVQDKLESKVKERYPWFSFNALEDMYSSPREDLAIYGEGNLEFDPRSWQQLLASKARKLFDALEYKVRPRKPHWYYTGQISALQLGIGAVFGFKRAISILQLDFSNSDYTEVFTLYGKNNARELKNVSIRADECKQVEGQLQISNPNNRELGMILFLGSHNPIGEAKEFCISDLNVNNFLIIKARANQGVLQTDENWLLLVQEINALLNMAREEHSWRRIHLFVTAPTALCMALGIAIGHFLPVELYHYQYDAPGLKYKAMYAMDKALSYVGDEI
ncbi:MAG: SAVED domain-containing protein [Candidatus Cloacimonadota bacterium]